MKLIKVPIYDAKVYFFTDKQEFCKKVDDDVDVHDFTCWSEGTVCHILVSNLWDDYKSPKYLQCLTHECNHAAINILGNIGVEISHQNQEALCYLQDYIFRRCYEYCLKIEKLES